MKLQTLERAQQATIAKQIATGMYSAGARVTPSGYGAFGRGTPVKREDLFLTLQAQVEKGQPQRQEAIKQEL